MMNINIVIHYSISTLATPKKQVAFPIEVELDKIKKLLILQMYYRDEIPAELIAKAVGLNANSIRNMFQKDKIKRRTKTNKSIK